MEEVPQFYPKSQSEWREWLIENHENQQAVWLVFYKKKSPKLSLSWSDAVDEALCFGWIDSVKKTVDHEQFIQYFSKRKPNGTWSKINKEKIEQLTSEGRMFQAGLQAIETAKENGSWTILDDVEALIPPADLQRAWSDNPEAQEFYDQLSNSKKKMVLAWLVFAKQQKTRDKRIREIITNANLNLLPKHMR